MEFSLNLAWLLLATTSGAVLGYRLFRVDDSRRPGAPKWHFVVALGLCSVILFFVISMTDDLHELQTIAEESGSSGVLPKARWAASNEKHFASPDFSQVFHPEGLRHSVTNFCINYVEVRRVAVASVFQCIPPAGRAPPSQPV